MKLTIEGIDEYNDSFCNVFSEVKEIYADENEWYIVDYNDRTVIYYRNIITKFVIVEGE